MNVKDGAFSSLRTQFFSETHGIAMTPKVPRINEGIGYKGVYLDMMHCYYKL